MIRLFMAGIAALFLTIAPASAGERTVTLGVENMTSATCPYIVKQTLAAVPGETEAEVSAEDKTASVTFDDTQTDVPALTAATAASGYPSRLAKIPGSERQDTATHRPDRHGDRRALLLHAGFGDPARNRWPFGARGLAGFRSAARPRDLRRGHNLRDLEKENSRYDGFAKHDHLPALRAS